jgi:hypothetical protein
MFFIDDKGHDARHRDDSALNVVVLEVLANSVAQ